MQAPDMQVPTFPCSSCGQALPGTMPKGMKFPCPYCGVQVVSQGGWTADQAAQYQAWAMEHGATAAAQADQGYREQHNPGAAHFASNAEPVVARLPSGELLGIGAQVTPENTWMMRAVDLRTQQTRWEGMQGTTWHFPPSMSHVAVRGERIYVAHEGHLTALSLADGSTLWQAFLPGVVERDCDLFDFPDELMLFEIAGGVVLVTEAGLVMAVDGRNGATLWHQQYDDHAMIHALPAAVLVEASEAGAVLHAMPTGQVMARWTSESTPSFDDVVVAGGVLLAHVSELGEDESGEGVAIIDPANPTAVHPIAVKDPEFSPDPAFVDGKVFVALNATKPLYAVLDPRNPPKKPGFFARMFGGGGGQDARLLPAPGMAVDYVHAAGSLILFQMRPYEGGDGRRILGIRSGDGSLVFDSGPLAEEPSNMVPAHIQARPDVFVYVTSPSNDDEHCELRAVDPATGQMRWSADVGHWTHHFIAHDVVVVYSWGPSIRVLDLATGSAVAGYPFG